MTKTRENWGKFHDRWHGQKRQKKSIYTKNLKNQIQFALGDKLIRPKTSKNKKKLEEIQNVTAISVKTKLKRIETWIETQNNRIETQNNRIETRNNRIETRNNRIETRNNQIETRNKSPK